PPDDGVAAVPIPFGLQVAYVSEAESRLIMTGSGTQAVPFGTVASAKLLLLEYEQDAAGLPILVKFNGSADSIELKPGGFLAYGSPDPTSGITSISLVRTGDAVVRVRLFG